MLAIKDCTCASSSIFIAIMNPEVILIDTDSDSDCVICNDGPDNGFFIVSKQENLDEPVETVSHSSSVSLPDLSLSDCEISGPDSVAVVPIVTAITAEPENRLRVDCMSRSPILQKLMKTSNLFNENTASSEEGVSGTNGELKAHIGFDSSASAFKPLGISDEDSDVGLNCDIPSISFSRCVLSEPLNCDGNFVAGEVVSVSDSTNTSVPATATKMRLREEEIGGLEAASQPANEMHSSKVCKGSDRDENDDDDDDDDDELPSFLEVHQISKQVKQSAKRKDEKKKSQEVEEEEEESMEIVEEAEVDVYSTQTTASYSIDQLLAEHKETVRLRAMVADLQMAPSTTVDETPNQDDLLPEHKKELDRMNVVENKISDVHPGEKIFFPCDQRPLFAFPSSLTLASCGFIPGQSQTDQQLCALPSDDLLEFLDPEFIDVVFPAISSKESFLRFIFYLLSVSPDSRTSRRLHRIVYRVIHGRKSSWTPSTLDICRIFVNYGASLCSLCPDLSLVSFSERDLQFVNCEACKDWTSTGTENSTGFEIENLKFVIQLLTDALAVRPENYSCRDCLTLTLILFRVSLDHRLSMGDLHLDLEMFFAAVINAIPPDNWKDWVRDLSGRALAIADNHHNLVYIVGLMPLVERGMHLQRVLSLVFMHKYLPLANKFDDLLEPMVKHSLNFLESLRFNDKDSDFYLTWSLVNLLEYSVGLEPLPAEANAFAVLVNCLQLKISKIKDYINKVDHILLKDLMVLLVSKWNIMARTFGKKELFASATGPIMVQSISSQVENDSYDEEASVDIR